MEVVVLEKPASDGPLSKHITLVEGKIHSDGGPCRMWRGEARVVEVAKPTDFAALIDSLTPQQAISVGVIAKAYRPADGTPLKIVRKIEWRGEREPSAGSRTALSSRRTWDRCCSTTIARK